MAVSTRSVHLGYEVGSGKPVEIPIRHMAVTGQTQESGKTTTLEALIERSGLSGIAFLTKRGEGSFKRAKKILPFFKERADWQFVQAILESVLRQNQQFKQPWIMRACEGANSLADVQRRARQLEEAARKDMSRDMYMVLATYLDDVVPLIHALPKTSRVELHKKELVVMDLVGYPQELQMLVISSTLQWIHEHTEGVITVVPEAWKFLPQGKNTPVKFAAEGIYREGAGLRNYLWVDSQDLASVDKAMVRACAVCLIGVQREANELKRTINNMPEGLKRPKVGDVATLEVGQFFACHGREIVKTYVQPVWIPANFAQMIAKGDMVPSPQKFAEWESANLPKELRVTQRFVMDPFNVLELARRSLESGDTQTALEAITAALEAKRKPLGAEPTTPLPSAGERPLIAAAAPPRAAEKSRVPDLPEEGGELSEQLFQAFKARLLREPDVIQVLNNPLHVEISHQPRMVQVNTDNLDGRMVYLIAHDFFNERKGNKDVLDELADLGWPDAAPNVSKAFGRMVRSGLLREDGSGRYRVTRDVQAKIQGARK